MFRGTFTALVTPFNSDNQVNLNSLTKLIDFQLNNGIDGLVPCGTTGESPTLSLDEKKIIIKHTINQVDGRIPIIAGTGSYDTKSTIEMTKWAWQEGALGALLITPYYNKPTQNGLYLHYKAISEAVPEIELVIYNVPSRTNVNILPETVEKLVNECLNINTIKEASGDLSQVLKLNSLCGDKLTILSGEDGLIWPYISCSAKGVVSVVSNLAPKLTKEIVDSGLGGDSKNALHIQQKLNGLIEPLFTETNPIPIKFALNKAGFNVGSLRLPLHELSDDKQEKLINSMNHLGIL